MPFVKISKHTHDIIAEAILRANLSAAQIARSCNVSVKTIQRASENLWHVGENRPQMGTRGRRRTINLDQEQWIIDFIVGRVTIIATEVIWEFFDEYDVVISPRIVYDTLHRRNFTKKVLRRTAAERSPSLRTTIQRTIALYRPDQLMFVDELAANKGLGREVWVVSKGPRGSNRRFLTA